MDERGFSGGIGRIAYEDLDTLGVFLTEPDTIDAQASSLSAMAETLRSTGRVLADVSVAGTWVSASGRTFGTKVAAVPTTLDEVAQRFEDIATLLTRHASALRDHVAELDRIGSRYASAGRELDSVLTQRETATDEELPALDARHEELQRDTLAEQRAFEEESQAAVATDDALVRDLESDVASALDDPWHYDALDAVARLGTWCDGLPGAAGLIPYVKVVQAAGSSAGLVATTGKVLFYGEGSWSTVAAAARTKLVGLVAGKGGPLARKLAGNPSPTRRASHLWGPRSGTGRGAPRTGSSAYRAPGVTAWARRQPRAAHRKAVNEVKEQTGLSTARQIRDDWRAVAGGGPVAKGVVVVSGAAKTTQLVEDKKSQVESAQTRARAIREGDYRAAASP